MKREAGNTRQLDRLSHVYIRLYMLYMYVFIYIYIHTRTFIHVRSIQCAGGRTAAIQV